MSNIDISRPDERNPELRSRVADEYRWGFVTDIEQETVPRVPVVPSAWHPPSMMAEAVHGKTVDETRTLFHRVHRMLAENAPAKALANCACWRVCTSSRCA